MARDEITKYFTVRGGVVGTAHQNRDGKEVDFRPAKKVVISTKGIRAEGDMPDEEVVRDFLVGVRVDIIPAKGVHIGKLELTPTCVEHEAFLTGTQYRVRVKRVEAVYKGMRLAATTVDWCDGPCIVGFISLAGRQAKAAAEAETLRLKREQNAAAAGLTPTEAITFGKPVWSHLRDERMWRQAAERIQGTLLKHLGLHPESYSVDVKLLPEWAQKPETLRSRILEERDARRARSGGKK